MKGGWGGINFDMSAMMGWGGMGGGAWADPNWGSKKRKKAAAWAEWGGGAAEEEDIDAGLPTQIWFEVDFANKIVTEGFPADSVALCYNKKQHAFRDAHHICYDMAGEITEEVQFTHDSELDTFTDIAAAIKAAGGEEMGICVATCPNAARWGVGVANSAKDRERSAKLALALSMAKDNTKGTDLETMANNYPPFGGMLHEAGLVTNFAGYDPTPAAKAAKTGGEDFGAGSAGIDFSDQFGMLEAAFAGNDLSAWGKAKGKGGAKGGAKGAWQPTPVGIPDHKPTWITCADGMPAAMAELEPSTLCMKNTGKSGLPYGQADRVLAMFGLDPTGADGATEFHDDAEWTMFPEIGKALAALGSTEDSMHVAVSAANGVWAVGLGSKWKSREAAAKMALGLALAQKAAASGQMMDYSAFPFFAQLVAQTPQA